MLDQQRQIGSKLNFFQARAFYPSIKNNPFSHYNRSRSLCISLCQKKKYLISNKSKSKDVNEGYQSNSPQSVKNNKNISQSYKQLSPLKNKKLLSIRNPQTIHSQTQIKNFTHLKKPYKKIITKLYPQPISIDTNQIFNSIIISTSEPYFQTNFSKKKLSTICSKVFYQKYKLKKIKDRKKIMTQSYQDDEKLKSILFPFIEQKHQQPLKTQQKQITNLNKQISTKKILLVTKQKHKKQLVSFKDNFVPKNRNKSPSRLSPWHTLYKDEQKC